MPLERAGAVSTPMTRMKPQVIAGVCEYCGTIDGNQPPEVQYKLCPHFKGLMEELKQQGQPDELRCSYCPQNADPVDVLKKARMKVHESPTRPGYWIAVCDSYNCELLHEKRFVHNA